MYDLIIVFNYYLERKLTIMYCKETDILNDVFARYCLEAGLNINELKFFANGVEVPPSNNTLFALGINNKTNNYFCVVRPHIEYGA